MGKKETEVKGDGIPSPMVETPQTMKTTTFEGLLITPGDRWFTQLLSITIPWTRHMQAVLGHKKSLGSSPLSSSSGSRCLVYEADCGRRNLI